MSIIELLMCENTWEEFLEYKVDGGHLSKQQEARLAEYIQD